MRELTKSIGSFSWALSLFGMRQMANVLCPSRAAEAFDGVTEAAEAELGGLLRSTFELGDRMQRSFVDMAFLAFPSDLLDARSWSRTASEAARGVAGAANGAARSAYGATAGPVPPQRAPDAESGWGPMPGGPGRSAAPAADAATSGWGPMGP